jgi:hypothetical protein
VHPKKYLLVEQDKPRVLDNAAVTAVFTDTKESDSSAAVDDQPHIPPLLIPLDTALLAQLSGSEEPRLFRTVTQPFASFRLRHYLEANIETIQQTQLK